MSPAAGCAMHPRSGVGTAAPDSDPLHEGRRVVGTTRRTMRNVLKPDAHDDHSEREHIA